MTKASSTGGRTDPGATKRGERAERLSAALKANLRRRKAQARERGAGQPGHGAESEPVQEAVNDCANKAPPGQAS
jgi:hypothetical protein